MTPTIVTALVCHVVSLEVINMNNNTFEFIQSFPDPVAQEKYLSLFGIDHIKSRLERESSIILNPSGIENWSKKFYNKEIKLITLFKNRPPLFIFSGDVGTGKTVLAESFADQVARQEEVKITLYKLSLNARGSGIVGEMTKLISESFEEIRQEAHKQANTKGAFVLFIDEADALAQSREAVQMHHEDKAGVNALIRGIDSLRDLPTPAMIVMCTNRLTALDPAIRRRSAVTFEFNRPSKEQCEILLKNYLSDLELTEEQIGQLAAMCVPYDGLNYGYTYSDLTQKVLPAMLLNAYPDKQIDMEIIIEVIKTTMPTAPFNEIVGS